MRIGALFASINGAVNMFFAFSYAGGLAQYWVILVAYPLCKATEWLPAKAERSTTKLGEACVV